MPKSPGPLTATCALAVLITMAALAVPSCRSPRPAGLPGVPADVDQVYEVEWLPAGPTVAITVHARGDESGRSVFVLQERSKAKNLKARIAKLEARDSHNRPLTIEPGAGLRWVVEHAPSETLTLRYHIAPGERPQPSEYGPMITREFCLLIGGTALLSREDPKADTATPSRRRTIFRWRGFTEAGLAIASSFGRDRQLDFTLPTTEFFTTQFLAAPILTVVERSVGDRRVLLAVAGPGWKADPNVVADTVRTIVSAGRALFQDPGPPFFLVSVVPAGFHEKVGDGYSFRYSGTGLTNSFALLLSPEIPFAVLKPRLEGLLAHELLHTWFGHTIQSREDDGAISWFMEGFTNFYTRRLLYRAGLLPADRYADDVNESIAKYSALPTRTAPNARIAAAFLTPGHAPEVKDLIDLPYRRGDLLAMLVDHEIRTVSAGARSLDDLVRALAKRGAAGEVVSTETLLGELARATSPRFGARLAAVVRDGAPVEFPPGLLAPCLKQTQGAEPPRFAAGDLAACAGRL